jgi:hypothetical protein
MRKGYLSGLRSKDVGKREYIDELGREDKEGRAEVRRD